MRVGEHEWSDDAATCRHRFEVFSRVVCACGWMHTYCSNCDTTAEPCDVMR